MSALRSFTDSARSIARSVARTTRQLTSERLAGRGLPVGSSRHGSRRPGAPHDGRDPAPAGLSYPGDFHGIPHIVYAPKPDGIPDPGEVVWTWVPYEEDNSVGKDRPVLLIARDGDWLLALPMTSKNHHRDEDQERRAGRLWADLGSGSWDSRGRESEVRVNRIVRVDPAFVRREGAIVDAARFEHVRRAVLAALD